MKGAITWQSSTSSVTQLSSPAASPRRTSRPWPSSSPQPPSCWTTRGVAVGDGKVFVGLLDARLIALDQKTGEVLWETTVAEWEEGYTITSAPLFYNGKVYTGVAGGEYGIRGRVMAYDADLGFEVWRFYTIPGPGDINGDTWPADSDAWLTGGGPVWNTPSVDPELGYIYFATGNTAPDLDGSNREGDNLYANSVVAVNAENGQYVWHFQEVHHDIWDMDPANPVVLYDVEMDGKMRKGLGQAGKTGWVYLLDRADVEAFQRHRTKITGRAPEEVGLGQCSATDDRGKMVIGVFDGDTPT